MNNFSDMFNIDLINLNNLSDSKEEFFKTASSILKEKGLIKETFESAISCRENLYPTGLSFPNFDIAIPHTDTEHIIKPFIFVNKMVHHIDFIHMGTDDTLVKPQYIFILGIKEPTKQVGLLSKLMEMFSATSFSEEINSLNNEKDILNLLKKNI